MAQNQKQTINEMTSPGLNQQPLCIEYPTLDVDFELKSGLIHLLPTFRGLAGEDPYKHLKEFHMVCSGMRPQGVTEEQVKLRAFPFSLGLSKANRSLVDAASGGALYDKTPTEARKLITTMAANNQQFGSRSDSPPQRYMSGGISDEREKKRTKEKSGEGNEQSGEIELGLVGNRSNRIEKPWMDVVPSTTEPVVAFRGEQKARLKAFGPEISSHDSRKVLDNNHLQEAMVKEIQ
ncbi:UNVERIFIED_CONTAM: hypothetical protein Scaly_2939500 [Sesamum calycinum]|uniref:Uncharacterized protein n=1 Tax=Sesamum calycinum TaxID=2727403 RepID=A0AAW2KTL3_9LAMI